MVTDKEKDQQRDIRQKGLGKQIQIQIQIQKQTTKNKRRRKSTEAHCEKNVGYIKRKIEL